MDPELQQDTWKRIDENESTQYLPPYDKALGTRKTLLVTFILCLLLSLAGFVTGVYSRIVGFNCTYWYDTNIVHQCNTFTVSSVSISKMLTLLLTVVIAICTECLGYIHSTSLRWALAKEGRLVFNSNLRLFSSARTSYGNGRAANVFSTFCLILCYAGASCAIYEAQDYDTDVELFYLKIYSIGTIGAATGLLGLCIVTSIGWWTEERSNTIKSWNPSPLNTTLACLHHNLLHRSARRSNLPDKLDNVQPSALQTIPALRYINRFTVFISCITLSLAGILFAFTWNSYLKKDTDFSYPYQWSFFPTTLATQEPNTSLLGVSPPGSVSLEIWSLLWSLLWQSISTLTFHVIELVVNVRRDETCWRKAANKGAAFRQNAFSAAFSNKGSISLFLLKSIGQWIYALGFYTVGDEAIGVNSLPLFVLSVPLGLMALVTIITSRHHPKGSLPSTYGHLQTIADLVDDWGEGAKGKLYWGDKDEFIMYHGDRIPLFICRRSGTAGDKNRIGEIQMMEKYALC